MTSEAPDDGVVTNTIVDEMATTTEDYHLTSHNKGGLTSTQNPTSRIDKQPVGQATATITEESD